MAGPISSVFRPGLFSNKVAIVTGGATGIGNAITKELLFLGCNVVMASRKLDNLQGMEAVLQKEFPPVSDDQGGGGTHPRVAAMQCNIRKEDEVEKLFDQVLAKYGRVDYVVNNGGGQFPSPAADISLKGWNAVIDTNLNGTFIMCKQAYKSWMKEHGGSIVSIITDMWKGWPNMAHSGAARAGVDNLTKSLAVEWAQNGIRVNSVAPGSSIWSKTAAANYADPQLFQATLPKIPARRLGKPEEISAAVCYLLSPAAAYVTGETIKVDGAASLYGQLFWQVPDHSNMPAYSWEEDEEENKEASGKSKL